MDRRQFLVLLSALGMNANAASETPSPAAITYEEVRRRLEGKKIFILPYGHNDYGWLASNLWDRERTPLVHKEALELMRREPQFTWYFDTEFEALSWLLDRYPEVQGELKQRVAEGRWGIAPGSFCNPDNPFIEPEPTIRNLVLGRRDFEKRFPGVRLQAAVFNDIHPGHTQMPQILRKAGYEFYRVTRPIGALDLKGFKREFIWVGLDGSEVVLSLGPYVWQGGSDRWFEQFNRYQSDWRQAVVAFWNSGVGELVAHSASGLIWLPLGMDYGRPLRVMFDTRSDEPPIEMPGFVREWQRRETTPLVFATPNQYAEQLDTRRNALERVRGAIDPVGWPFWYGACGSRGLYFWRDEVAQRLVEAEIFCAMAARLGMPDAEPTLQQLWYEALTLYPHDGLYVGDEDVLRLVELGRKVQFRCGELTQAAMTNVSQRINVNPERQAIAIFNPLNWQRREPVQIHALFTTPGTRRVRVIDANGREIPKQLITLRHLGVARQGVYYKEAVMLVDAAVPPTGYTTVFIEPVPGSEEMDYPDSPVESLESSALRLQLGNAGIEALEDRLHAVRYARAGSPVYYSIHDEYVFHNGPVIGRAEVTGATWRLVEAGPLRTSAQMRGMLGDHSVELQVWLYKTVARVDYELTIDSRGGNGFFVVQVPVSFPGKLEAGIPFGAEPRDLSNEPFGPHVGEERLRPDVFYAHHWVDYSDGNTGITLFAAEGQRGFRWLPATHPASPSERSNQLEHILLMTIVPITPAQSQARPGDHAEWEALMVNRYFRGTGRHTFRYSLAPHAGNWIDSRALFHAQERLYPLRSIHVHPHGNPTLPSERSFIRVQPETVALSAWRSTESGFELRLYETEGKAADIELRLPFAPRDCVSVDFHGNPWPRPKLSRRGERVELHLEPWEIVTLRFE